MKCIIDRSKLRNNILNKATPFQASYSEGKTDLDAIKQYALNMLKKIVSFFNVYWTKSIVF